MLGCLDSITGKGAVALILKISDQQETKIKNG